ncbi:MAG: class I SAM-dependent methyltransferase [Phycisphaerae bacterium]|nr:class I SAM-dependent methyltransferase [Phycisphaerae bacterium]
MSDIYLFGDSDLAARRLKILADAFAPSTRAFLASASDRACPLAVDLGCGPGHTTHLLADTVPCERIVGLDNSQHFIRLAAPTATHRVSFRLHDVTRVPLPGGPCDLIFTRFLLTHQTDPSDLVAKWLTQLQPGGRLLLEETESIHTSVPAFKTYVDLVEAMLADAGHTLYVAPHLDRIRLPNTVRKRSGNLARIAPTNDLVARMFSMNLQTWKNIPFIREHYDPKSIHELEKDLDAMAATPTHERGIEWRLRQITLEVN